MNAPKSQSSIVKISQLFLFSGASVTCSNQVLINIQNPFRTSMMKIEKQKLLLDVL